MLVLVLGRPALGGPPAHTVAPLRALGGLPQAFKPKPLTLTPKSYTLRFGGLSRQTLLPQARPEPPGCLLAPLHGRGSRLLALGERAGRRRGAEGGAVGPGAPPGRAPDGHRHGDAVHDEAGGAEDQPREPHRPDAVAGAPDDDGHAGRRPGGAAGLRHAPAAGARASIITITITIITTYYYY